MSRFFSFHKSVFFSWVCLSSVLCFLQVEGSQNFSIGPEFCHVKRKKITASGDAKQNGWLYGVRGIYERQTPWGFYWALDSYYTYGVISGKKAPGIRLKSHFRDSQVEGRLGYSFCFSKLRDLTLTPYGGYGCFFGRNHFVRPTRRICTFNDKVQYGTVGLNTSFRLRSCWKAGLNVRAKFMTKGRSKITDDPDPDYNNTELQMKNETQYEVEVPVTYNTLWFNRSSSVSLTPFYRFQHHGAHINFPHDFSETKLYMYGCRLLVQMCF